jgi:hypothetical protein
VKGEIVEPCGCIKTSSPGHVHTKMCEHHRREFFAPGYTTTKLLQIDNLDLVGG